MRNQCPHIARRPGMTLVELLVVIGVLMLLLVTVIPNLSPTADQKGREAAATVVSMINRAKLRAEANGDTGAGVWLEPLILTGSYGGPVNNNVWWQLDGQITRMATLDMFACEPQNAYNGDNPDQARVLIYPINEPGYTFNASVPPTDYLALFELQDCTFIREFCGLASRIYASGDSYYFRLLTPGEQNALPASFLQNCLPRPYRLCNAGRSPGDPHYEDPAPVPPQTSNYYAGAPLNIAPPLVLGWVRTLPNAPQMASVTKTARVWYAYDMLQPTSFPVSSTGTPFAIQRPNVRSPTPPLTVPAGYAIDVSWSSIGTQLFHNAADVRVGQGGMTLLANFLANQPVQFMFDRTGALKRVVYKSFFWGFGGGQGTVVEQTIDVPADIFLLVGRADRVGLPYVATPTESNPGANWQYPDSRWVKISHLTGKTMIADPVLEVTNVYDSQGYARADISAVRN